MADTSSSTGAQNRDEKKDHPEQGRLKGHDDDNRFEDPQDLQAKGQRKHSEGKHDQEQPRASQQPGQPTDNTKPGGNRPKHMRQGTDHN